MVLVLEMVLQIGEGGEDHSGKIVHGMSLCSVLGIRYRPYVAFKRFQGFALLMGSNPRIDNRTPILSLALGLGIPTLLKALLSHSIRLDALAFPVSGEGQRCT